MLDANVRSELRMFTKVYANDFFKKDFKRSSARNL